MKRLMDWIMASCIGNGVFSFFCFTSVEGRSFEVGVQEGVWQRDLSLVELDVPMESRKE